MSERESYEHGTPSWIDHSSGDPEAAVAFYTGLFGWEAENQMPPEEGKYFICSVRGKSVAAIGAAQAEGAPAAWSTYVTVDSADDMPEKVKGAGGNVVTEPFDVYDFGRMAVFTDPAGAFFCVWQAGTHVGAEIVNEPGALVWNELMTRDVEGAKAFYGTVFGWRMSEFPSEDAPPYTLLHKPGGDEPGMENVIGGILDLTADRFPAEIPPHWNAYVAVDDADAAVAKCEQSGGSVVMPAADMPWGRMAVLRDPLGAGFTILKMPEGQG